MRAGGCSRWLGEMGRGSPPPERVLGSQRVSQQGRQASTGTGTSSGGTHRRAQLGRYHDAPLAAGPHALDAQLKAWSGSKDIRGLRVGG